jgi:peptidoglycan/xylan/chitin deacetylase (PgdA/CDA1 family)
MIGRRAASFGVVLGAAIALALGVTSAAANTSEDAAGIACEHPAGSVLGTSRVIEIDTTGGPTYGDQYPPSGLLKPGEVVLTFDDGPFPAVTKDILATLAAQCVKATFFYVGRMAKAYPLLVNEVHAQGHTVGTHTWSHRNLGASSFERGVSELESAIAQADQALPGKVAPFFRFPYLSDNKRVLAYLKTRDIATFSIDVDSVDYRARTPDKVLSNVMSGLAKTGGGIILFHDIHANTARALPAVLAALKEGGYKVVHLVAKSPVKPVATTPVASAKPRKPKRPARRPRKTGGLDFL